MQTAIRYQMPETAIEAEVRQEMWERQTQAPPYDPFKIAKK